MELDRAPGYGEIGYWVAKAARGKGVATRAVVLLRDYAAAELGLELIELIIHEGNDAVEAGRRADGVPRHRARSGSRRARRARPSATTWSTPGRAS